ncbi:hypothetical protein TSOC_002166 [Tetrabaena socialis]|uniref:RING-type domain-containing protein n=1 Tax=Tetrabaena socialis TaxID=47790 RepID=A0A2J8AER6_9CHLO|nr:hypothetical protein TSOC_002166 [Tetrabaena socialis]|eukprot:PNH11021.1 hypothetical protein TSOC_002166 [Tetrabaena socialis]
MCLAASRIAAHIILWVAVVVSLHLASVSLYQLACSPELRPINGYASQNQALFWIGDRPNNREFLESRTREAGAGVLKRHEGLAAPPRSVKLEWAVSPVMPLRRPVSSKTYVAGGVVWRLSLSTLAGAGLPLLAGAVARAAPFIGLDNLGVSLTAVRAARHWAPGDRARLQLSLTIHEKDEERNLATRPRDNTRMENTFDAEHATLLLSNMLSNAVAAGPWRLRFTLEIHGGMAAWKEGSTHLEAQYGRALGEQLLLEAVLSNLNLVSELQPEASLPGRPPAPATLQTYVAGPTGGGSSSKGGESGTGARTVYSWRGVFNTSAPDEMLTVLLLNRIMCNGVNRDRAEEVMHELLDAYRLRNLLEGETPYRCLTRSPSPLAPPPSSGGVRLAATLDGGEEETDRYGQPLASYLWECQQSAQAPPLYLPPPGCTTLYVPPPWKGMEAGAGSSGRVQYIHPLARESGSKGWTAGFEEPWGLTAKAARAKESKVCGGGRACASVNGRDGGDSGRGGGGGEEAVRTVYLSPLRRAPLDPNQALYAGNLLWLVMSRVQWLARRVPLPSTMATSGREALLAVGGPHFLDRWESSGAARFMRRHGGMGLPLAMIALFSPNEYVARLMADADLGRGVGRVGKGGGDKLMNWQGQFVHWHGGDAPPGTAEVAATASKLAALVLCLCAAVLVVYHKRLPVRALMAYVGRAWSWQLASAGCSWLQATVGAAGSWLQLAVGSSWQLASAGGSWLQATVGAAWGKALQALLLLAQLPAWSREQLLAACAAAWMQVRRNLARFGTWLAGLAADDQRQQQPQQQQPQEHQQPQQPQGQQQQQQRGGAGGGGAVGVAGVGSGAAAGDDDAELCLICMDGPRRHGLLHSGTVHVCVCDKCADDLRKRLTRQQQQQRQGARRRQAPQRAQQQQLACPLCRALVEDVVKVY